MKMEFTKEEEDKLLEYTAFRLMNICNMSLVDAREFVKNSILVGKIKTNPNFIAHCSMSQLVDMVRNER